MNNTENDKSRSNLPITRKEFTKLVKNPGLLETKMSDINKPSSTQNEEESNEQALEGQFKVLAKDLLTLDELLSLDVSEIPFLVERMIPKYTITFITGESDIGKSLLTSQISLAVCYREKVVDKLIYADFKKAILINTEDSHYALSYRLKKQIEGMHIEEHSDKRFKILLNPDSLIKRITQLLEEEPVDLIVIDAFADLFTGDINQSPRVREFLQKFSNLIIKYHCTFLIVHHIGKGKEKLGASKEHMLGSVGIEGKARHVLQLKETSESEREVWTVKGNYVNTECKKTPFRLKFLSETLHFNTHVSLKPIEEQESTDTEKVERKNSPDPLIQAARKMRYEGMTIEAIGKKLGRSKSTISRWFKEHPPISWDTSSVGPVP